MACQGNSFSREYSTSYSSETSFPKRHSPKRKFTEYLYSIDNEVVDDLRRITRAYAKKIGGLPIIPALPRREFRKKDRPYLEDLVLVEYFEEMVETTLQESVQPLNQLGIDSPHRSQFQTHVQFAPQSPPRIMVNVNANQPPPPPTWRARSPLNLTPPLHAMPQNFDKALPKFEPN